MSPVTHFLIGWTAGAAAKLDHRERVLVALAGIAPDADAFGVVPELLTRNSAHPLPWFTLYHHVLFHNLVFAVAITAAAWFLARRQKLKALLLCFISVHLHFLGDIVGARGPDGYQWPIPYFAPFSDRQLSWSGEWPLASWQNMMITLTFLSICVWFAVARQYSPVEVVSTRADAAVVGVLRKRLGKEA